MRGRRLLDITGVKQVESFDSEEFLLETVMGFLTIRGQKFANEELGCRKGHCVDQRQGLRNGLYR
ncbi:hypothetical protein GCM10020331_018710 [Ectobacillus funiculus]